MFARVPFILASLGIATGAATAQNSFDRFDQALQCKGASGSRIESQTGCEELSTGATVVIEHELEITTRVEGGVIETHQCQADVTLSYVQKNTLASVEGMIGNRTCAASRGSVVLSVRTRNEQGEQATQEFTQSWERDDARPVSFEAEFPIGENVDLTRVRATAVQCTCTGEE
jgi:hypothetical protein